MALALTENAKNVRGVPKLTCCQPKNREGSDSEDDVIAGMPRNKMTSSEGAFKRHRDRYYFSGWKGEGSDS